MLEKINSPSDLKELSTNQLPDLCSEIRNKIIDVMKRNGGHLASNLGVVEITTALHYVFDSPQDKIIFDVGHQSYTHKILTGRRDSFDSIRLENGLSGFPRRKESVHDLVDTGHSATSISSAAGFAQADVLKGRKNHTICVIGDGSLTSGEAFEGLNFLGHRDLPVVIIVNDNDMSISPNVGGLSKHFWRLTLTRSYQKLTDLYEYIIRNKKGLLKFVFWVAKKFEYFLKGLFGMENVFSNLGYEYIGPYNGHNIDHLVHLLSKIKKNVFRPVILHLKTKKGKGYLDAEGDPSQFHGVTPYLMINGKVEIKDRKTFTDVFSEKMLEMGEKYKNLVAISAAMESGTGLSLFNKKFQGRFFDVGIAEQHAVTFASGLAYNGMKPVCALYSTFLQRAYDQIFQDVCISKSSVIFAIDRAGVVGRDGETHQGQFDVSYLRSLPNITIMAPACAAELKLMLEYAYTFNGPIAIRYPRDTADVSSLDNIHPPIDSNPFIYLNKGSDILLIVIGPFIRNAQKACLKLCDEGFNPGLLYLRQLKPINLDRLYFGIKDYKTILVVEESVFSGSAGQEIISGLGLYNINVSADSICLPDKFIEHSSRQSILTRLDFDSDGIYSRALKLLSQSKIGEKK